MTVFVKEFGTGQSWPYCTGYCLKDMGQSHFDYVVFNMTPVELRAGIAKHLDESRAWDTNKIALNKHNVIAHMFAFQKRDLDPNPVPPAGAILTLMFETGKYVPDPNSFAVGQLLNFGAFSACWDIITHRVPLNAELVFDSMFSDRGDGYDSLRFQGPSNSPWRHGVVSSPPPPKCFLSDRVIAEVR